MNSDTEQLKRITRLYNELKTKDYLLKMSIHDARIAFSYRSGTLNIKCFRKYSYTDTICRACGNDSENINHIVNLCNAIKKNSELEYLDIESEEVTTIKLIVDRVKSFRDFIEH